MVPVTTSTSYSDRLRQWRENRWNIYMEIIFTFGKTMSLLPRKLKSYKSTFGAKLTTEVKIIMHEYERIKR